MSSPAAAPPPAALSAAGPSDAPPARPRNRIQVSREKPPLNFFVGLAKKFLLSEEEVELSGLGLAVTTVVTVAEILRNAGAVHVSRIETSLVDMAAEGARGVSPKAKIQIWITRGPNFDAIAAVTAAKPRKSQAAAAAAADADADANGDAIDGVHTDLNAAAAGVAAINVSDTPQAEA
jgi:DNA-binding protein